MFCPPLRHSVIKCENTPQQNAHVGKWSWAPLAPWMSRPSPVHTIIAGTLCKKASQMPAIARLTLRDGEVDATEQPDTSRCLHVQPPHLDAGLAEDALDEASGPCRPIDKLEQSSDADRAAAALDHGAPEPREVADTHLRVPDQLAVEGHHPQHVRIRSEIVILLGLARWAVRKSRKCHYFTSSAAPRLRPPCSQPRSEGRRPQLKPSVATLTRP